jgi:hypothetical protein
MSKLIVKDNWHDLMYFFEGTKINSMVGGDCEILLPDGSVETHLYVSEPKTGTYMDMGHSCEYTTRQLVVNFNYHGLFFQKPLEELEVINMRSRIEVN